MHEQLLELSLADYLSSMDYGREPKPIARPTTGYESKATRNGAGDVDLNCAR